jgi:hypothetical protein
VKIALIIPAMAILSAIGLLIGAASSVNAGHHDCSMFGNGIKDLDNNNDNMVSFEEYSAYHSQRLQWSFNALDTDNNGAISTSEWDTFLEMHGVGKNYDANQQS